MLTSSNIHTVVSQNLKKAQTSSINNLCKSDKPESLIHEHLPKCATGKDEMFVEHVTYADPNVCFYFSNLFNKCLMHGKFHDNLSKLSLCLS